MNKKFVDNSFGIKNNRGQMVSLEYLKQYIECYCRKEDYDYNRKANLKYFVSPDFLEEFRDKPAAEVAKAAMRSDRWNAPVKAKAKRQGNKDMEKPARPEREQEPNLEFA